MGERERAGRGGGQDERRARERKRNRRGTQVNRRGMDTPRDADTERGQNKQSRDEID